MFIDKWLKRYASFMILPLLIIIIIIMVYLDIENEIEISHVASYEYQYIDTFSSEAITNQWQATQTSGIDKSENIEGYFAMRLTTTSDEAKFLMIPQIYGSQYMLLDENMNEILLWDSEPSYKNYSFLVNMAYVLVEGKIFYIIIEETEGLPYIGIDPETHFQAVDVAINSFNLRQTVAFFLLFLACIMILLNLLVKDVNGNIYLRHTGYFVGIFGLWVIFDLYRSSYWITQHFRIIPIPVIIFIYILSSNLMVPLFVKLTKTLLRYSILKVILNYLEKWTWLVAFSGLGFEIIRFVYWDVALHGAYQVYFVVYDLTIIIGSLIMIILAWLDAPRRPLKGFIYAIGISTCLFSFALSQMSLLLISHWGGPVFAGFSYDGFNDDLC